MISSSSFNQSLTLSIQLKRKKVKNTLEQTACDLEFYTERIWRLIANLFLVEKNGSYKNENEAWPSDLMGSSR